jgi:NCAIR mutase (PurE)-related protein
MMDYRHDENREERLGFNEAIFCAHKSREQLDRILREATEKGRRLLLTRLSQKKFESIDPGIRAFMDYDKLSRSAFFGDRNPGQRYSLSVAIVTGGTSDSSVAMECARTLKFYGVPYSEFYDVGVAGLHRLLSNLEEIRQNHVVIAIAGMDAALPTVLAGLYRGLVVAVPTSVGYGAAKGGKAALNALLASCAPGLAVTNIDNGYGAACIAIRMIGMTKAE